MRLKELRIAKHLSQDDIGEIVQHSGQTILNWENEIHDPSVKDLIILAEFFGVSVDYLIGRDVTCQKKNDVCCILEQIPKEDFVQFLKASVSKILDECDKENEH